MEIGAVGRRSAVAEYLRECAALGTGPLDRQTLARLARMQRAAKKEWGESGQGSQRDGGGRARPRGNGAPRNRSGPTRW